MSHVVELERVHPKGSTGQAAFSASDLADESDSILATAQWLSCLVLTGRGETFHDGCIVKSRDEAGSMGCSRAS